MSDQKFLAEFKRKFNEFRTIEANLVYGKHKENSCTKAFSLLREMEISYAAGAYYACLIIACTSIEACLNHEFENHAPLVKNLKKSGYSLEANWLRDLRNAIIHKDDNSIIPHHLTEEHEEKLKNWCREAFVLVHTIYYEPINSAEPA